MQARNIILGGAIALPVLLVAKHMLLVYIKTSPARRTQIIETDSIPDPLRQSRTNRDVVNPREHIALYDTRYMDVQLPSEAKVLNDETLLAAFLRGFFGGRVFAPERALLRFFRPDIVNFSVIQKSPRHQRIWDVEQLDADNLPDLHTVLFGGFQVAHLDLAEQCAEDAETLSSIDVVFGSDSSQFSGVHRFTVTRNAHREDSIRITYAHIVCNPTVNEVLKPAFLFTLHKLYAKWLFREGVVEVMRRIQSGK
ncbi:hypothetical protein CC79DRAFT_1362954 [Sarocladium strictum]